MSLMDVARGAYVRSPLLVRRSLAPFLALVPTGLKFGATYRKWRERIAAAATDPALADAQHLAALRALLQKAHAGSPFYRDLIDTAFGPGFDLATLQLTDLPRLPVLNKDALRAAGDGALAVPAAELDGGATNGSNTDKPFTFYLDKDRSAREMAFVYDVWSRIGFDEQTPRACFRGFALDAKGRRLYDWDPALRELKLSVFPMTQADAALYLDQIDARAIRYLYGYPSAIELFCRHLVKLGRAPKLPLHGVLPISEPLHPHQRRVIHAALGPVPLACFYGLSEKVLFAAEVPGQAGVYDFNPLYGLAELVDEAGQRVTELGREGRLVGTGFLSTGMPFIRYDTGDFARLVHLPSAANGQTLRVSAMMPRRKVDFLVDGAGNRVVTTDLTSEDPTSFTGIEEFQFYQDQPGAVVIRYIPSVAGDTSGAERFAAYVTDRALGRIQFTLERVERIASGRGGKRAFIDQQLDIARY